MSWPASAEALIAQQARIGGLAPELWRPSGRFVAGGCFVCFGRGGTGPGAAGDAGWAAATIGRDGGWATRVVSGSAGAAYEAGLLALREGPLLEAAVRLLPSVPDVLLVNATGRDHPRRAGLAVHLGYVLGTPTAGVTHRPLVATGEWPGREPGATSPLRLGEEVVGAWLRTREGARPVAVHAGWRTDVETALRVVLAAVPRSRTPEPLRVARTAARDARAGKPPLRRN